jgi:predicted phage terminase large subunit-like protein
MAAAVRPEPPVRPVWQPQPGPQTAALTCPIGDLLFGGARGGGKTSYLLGDWLTHSARYPGKGRGILMRRSYDELDEVKAQAEELYSPIGARWEGGKNTWHMPWGGVLKLRYLERDIHAQRYQGHAYNWAAIDEAGNFPAAAPLDKIKGTLRDKHGIPVRLRMSANPGGPGHAWLKQRYIDPAPAFTPHQDATTGEVRVFIPSRLQDNQILMQSDPGYADRLKGVGPPWLVAAWLKGDWNATPEGGIIKAAWFRRYIEIPHDAELIVQSWDTAYKADQINDYAVCTTWAVGRFAYYLLHVHRERMEYPKLKQVAVLLADRFKPGAVLVEDKASGQSLIQELRAQTRLPVVAIEPVADKITRMNAASAMFEAGRVYFPERADWMLEYETELTIFPLAPHDDQVDSTSQFLNWASQFTVKWQSYTTGQQRAGYDSGSGSTQREAAGFGNIGRSDTTGFV